MALAKAAEPAYGIARLIGEGYGKSDGKDETPIDIQYGKLAEWLVSHASLCMRASPQSHLPLAVRFSGIFCCTTPISCVPMQGVRKHISTDWRKRLQAIQAAASAEMKSLPADFDQTASVSYFSATEIRDRLAESAEKGMFGGLKGSAGTWDKIVKAYEKQSKQVFVLTTPSWLMYLTSCMIYSPGRHAASSVDAYSLFIAKDVALRAV